MRGITLLLVMAILIGSAAGSSAMAMDKADLIVGMKILPLLRNKITGNLKIAIVFDPSLANSKSEAEEIKTIIDAGLDMPDEISTTAVLVPTDQMEKMTGSRIAIVTSNLKTDYSKISSAMIANNILTISTDLNCVYENKCIIGVVSKPHIEIYYSKTAAQDANVNFVQAFTMLAKPSSLLAGTIQ